MLRNPHSQQAPQYDLDIIAESKQDRLPERRKDDESGASKTTHHRFRTRRKQQVLAWFVVGAGTAGSIATVVYVLLSLERFVRALFELPLTDTLAPLAITCAILFLVAVRTVVPAGMRSLGIRLRKPLGNSVSRRIRRWCRMQSLADHLWLLRAGVVLSLAVALLTGAANATVGMIDGVRVAPLSNGWLASVLGCFCWLVAGWLIWRKSPADYRTSHDRELRRSLRAHHRGVALRSFIPAYDNPKREIYQTCRLSARIAQLHRTIYLAALGCFTAAACLATMLRSQFFAGEVLALIAILSIASLWPTCHSVVSWSGQLLDPFCADDNEYDEY